MRVAFALLVLTVLTVGLLTPDPFALLGFTRPDTRDVVDSIVSDKVQHAVAYAVLSVAVIFACSGSRLRMTLMGGGMSLGHGAATEVVQAFVPHRTCDWKDLVADAFGVALGAAAWNLVWVWHAARRDASRFSPPAADAARREPSLSAELPRA